MDIFCDMEFTDFENPVPISLGLAAANGATLYLELSGWQPEECSLFTQDSVLPQLEGPALSPKAAVAQLLQWLSNLPGPVRILADSDTDILLLQDLVATHAPERTHLGPPMGVLFWADPEAQQQFEAIYEELLYASPNRHHALADALTLRDAARAVGGVIGMRVPHHR